MSDLYKEIMVKRKSTPTDGLKRVGLIGATAVLFVAGLLIHPLIWIGAIGMGIACYFLLPGLNLEYEYLYVNGDIDIDKIMNQQKRKKCASYPVSELEFAAPSQSHELDSYKNNGNAKVRDFTSGEENVKSWTLVYKTENGTELVKLELDDAVINDLRRVAPRKVSRND